jgi:hypothetical protein
LIYESILAGDSVSSLKFCVQAAGNVNDSEYCYGLAGSKNLFACVGLHNKKYCILNKQYSKKEYEELVPKIKKHMDEMPYIDSKGRTYKYGEFFPAEISSFGYNESTAWEYFPLSKEDAIKEGHPWKEAEDKSYEPTKKWSELPEATSEVSDDVLKDVILCQSWEEDSEKAKEHNCTMAFKVIPNELAFYRQMNIPLPRKCPNTRAYERTFLRNPIKLWPRQCMCDYKVYENDSKHVHHDDGRCPNEFETSYAPERKEIVYCESCYQQEVA